MCDNAQATSTNQNFEKNDHVTGQQTESTNANDNNTKHVTKENDCRRDETLNLNGTKANDEQDVPNIITTAPSATDLQINSDIYEKAKVPMHFEKLQNSAEIQNS